MATYGAQLLRTEQLPEIAHEASNVGGMELAAALRRNGRSISPILIGDVEALKLLKQATSGLNSNETQEQLD